MKEKDGFFEALFRQVVMPTVTLTAQGMPNAWNTSFATLFETISGKPVESLKIPLFDYFQESESFQFNYWFHELMSGKQKSVSIESPLKAKSGTRFWFKASLSAFSAQDGTKYLLCVLDDITEQKYREKRLLTAKEEAEKATTTKSQFLANMSHEIRTPIQTISGMIELLHETTLDTEQEEYARQIGFSADILLSLVNDILDFSKIEAGKLELELIDFDTRKCIEQSVDMITLEAHRKGLEVLVNVPRSIPRFMHGDPSRIRQIILNLAKNAVKFTKSGEVEVTAFPVTKSDGSEHLRVETRDTGIGIPAHVRDHLFTHFYQGDSSTTRRFGGTGLGLAISRALVDMMQGTIGAKSNPDSGSTFFFEIPLIRPAYDVPDQDPVLPEGVSVLVVDDNAHARSLISTLLAEKKCPVTEASSGAEALAILRGTDGSSKRFSVILIDQFLKDMDGWHLGAEITQDKQLNDAKLILLSPEGMIGAEAKMKLLAWFNGYVNKPIKRNALLEAVQKATRENVDFDTADELAPAETESGAKKLTERSVTPTVLVAEDHPVNRELIKVLLEHAGVGVELAEDGQEAVEMAKRKSYDMVFMDIMMPRMNGYEATRSLRENGFSQPIVAVTASALKGERDRCLEAGMNDILTKPFKRNDIVTMINYWLNRNGEKGAEGAGKAGPHDGEPRLWDKSVFDFSGLVDTFLGRKEIVIDLIGKFSAKTESGIESIDAALVSGDTEKVKFEAHAIKGSAWNLQAITLGDAAAELEKAAKENDPETARALFPVLVEALKTAFRTFSECSSFYRKLEIRQ